MYDDRCQNFYSSNITASSLLLMSLNIFMCTQLSFIKIYYTCTHPDGDEKTLYELNTNQNIQNFINLLFDFTPTIFSGRNI